MLNIKGFFSLIVWEHGYENEKNLFRSRFSRAMANLCFTYIDSYVKTFVLYQITNGFNGKLLWKICVLHENEKLLFKTILEIDCRGIY